jgi:hypothetical protein
MAASSNPTVAARSSELTLPPRVRPPRLRSARCSITLTGPLFVAAAHSLIEKTEACQVYPPGYSLSTHVTDLDTQTLIRDAKRYRLGL